MEFKKFESEHKTSKTRSDSTHEVKTNKTTGAKILLTSGKRYEKSGWILVCTTHQAAAEFEGQRQARDTWHTPWVYCKRCEEIKARGGYKKLRGEVTTDEFDEFLKWKEMKDKEVATTPKK